MCKGLIPIGPLETETYEMINLINTYEMPADFFAWISGGTFRSKLLKEEISPGMYKRIAQYYIGNTLVFTGNGEFDLKKLPKEMIQNLTSSVTPIKQSIPGFDSLTRKIMTETSTELHYTVVAHLYLKNELVGYSWEIFELKKLIALYAKMNDPLRYWRQP